MKQSICNYAGAREDHIVSYLYDEIPLETRIAFERHLASCALCRSEVDALRGVRAEIGQWVSPEPEFSVTVPDEVSHRPAAVAQTSRWHVPLWAQAAAAVLAVGVAAGAANLDVRYSSAEGLSVRTGWQHADRATPAAAAPADDSWRAELTALEARFRGEMVAHAVSATAAPLVLDEGAMRRVKTLVQDSEQRQQREIALRFAEMAREVESQRQSDLVRIDRNLGLIQSRTGMEVMRTQQQVNNLAQRVSQRQ